MPITVDTTASYGSATGTAEHAALGSAWMLGIAPEAARTPSPFFLGREPWHPVKMIEIAFAISVPHQVAIRVLLNKKFQSKLTTSL